MKGSLSRKLIGSVEECCRTALFSASPPTGSRVSAALFSRDAGNHRASLGAPLEVALSTANDAG